MSEAKHTVNSRMKCRDIMTTQVITASSSETLRQIAQMMLDGDMGAVPIVDDNTVVGIVTDRDIVIRSVAEGGSPDDTVKAIMTGDIFSVKPDDFVFEAIRLMGDKQIRRVPVINQDGSLSGIIAMADIALESEDEREVADALEEISSGASFWSKK